VTRTKLDSEKVRVVLEFPIPRSFTNVKAFLGLIDYYNNCVKEYAHIIMPLFELTKQDVSFYWSPNCQKAFEKLMNALVFTPVLVILDFSKAFILDVDWSTKGVGVILSHKYGK